MTIKKKSVIVTALFAMFATIILGSQGFQESANANANENALSGHSYLLHTPEEARELSKMIVSGEHSRTPEILRATEEWQEEHGGQPPLFVFKIGDSATDAVYYDSESGRVYTSTWEVYIK